MLKFQPYGDAALLVTFGNEISEEIHSQITNYRKELSMLDIVGVTSVIPAFTTLTIQYNSLLISYDELLAYLKTIVVSSVEQKQKKIVRIPVCYADEFSLDMEDVIAQTGLEKEQIIQLHTEKPYLVYMLGFTPGFFYLGDVAKELFTERKKNPRLKIEKGSVGLAANQTGVYTVESPGGWNLIGKTPLKIFDSSNQENSFLIASGDWIQFYEISLDVFKNWKDD